MPKADALTAQIVYRCIEPFAVASPGGGQPEQYNLRDEVRGDHPILAGVHRSKFEPVMDNVLRREQTPQSFGPGDLVTARSATPNNESENINA